MLFIYCRRIVTARGGSPAIHCALRALSVIARARFREQIQGASYYPQPAFAKTPESDASAASH